MMQRLSSAAPFEDIGGADGIDGPNDSVIAGSEAAGNSDEMLNERGSAFEILSTHLATLHPAKESNTSVGQIDTTGSSASLSPLDVLELYDALLKFVLSSHPTRIRTIEATLLAASELLSKVADGVTSSSAKASEILMSIVLQPLRHFRHILRLLQLPSWPPLTAYLTYARQKEVAMELVEKVIAQV